MNLNAAAAIVSGGASGLGEATARDLAAAGCRGLVSDLNGTRGTELAKELGGEFARAAVADAHSVGEAGGAAGGLCAPRRGVRARGGVGWGFPAVRRRENHAD